MPSSDVVVGATGFSPERTNQYWPLIVMALAQEGIADEPVQIAAAATLKAELGPYFAPVSERHPVGTDAKTYFESKYGPQTRVGKRLGNTTPGDGYRFRGRGFIQLTGRSNYDGYGRRLGIPLVSNPDLALDATNAARIFAAYFKDRGVATAAMQGDWRQVRVLVNGGLNGWTPFSDVVGKLGGLPPTTATLPILGLLGAGALFAFARRWFS